MLMLTQVFISVTVSLKSVLTMFKCKTSLPFTELCRQISEASSILSILPLQLSKASSAVVTRSTTLPISRCKISMRSEIISIVFSYTLTVLLTRE